MTSRKHTTLRVKHAGGAVTKIRVTIPKRNRKNRLDEWRGLNDAYLEGIAEGAARVIDAIHP